MTLIQKGDRVTVRNAKRPIFNGLSGYVMCNLHGVQWPPVVVDLGTDSKGCPLIDLFEEDELELSK